MVIIAMAEADPSYRDRFGYLPAPLVMLIETVGEDVMLKIVATLGGTRLSLGPHSRRKSPLLYVVGGHAIGLIFERAAQDGLLRIDIPRMGRTLEMLRHIRVLRLRAEGTKIADIALALGMTERNIYYILAEDRATPDPRQIELPF
jgi:hypothetical protein